MSALRFGDDPPVDPTPMAYTGRAACGHIRIIVMDRGRVAALQDLADLYVSGLTLERLPVADAKRDFGECERCAVDQTEIGL